MHFQSASHLKGWWEELMAFEQGYALLIGVGTYAHHRALNVPITVADAKAVKKVLIDPSLCGYPDGHVTLLRAALCQVASTSEPEARRSSAASAT